MLPQKNSPLLWSLVIVIGRMPGNSGSELIFIQNNLEMQTEPKVSGIEISADEDTT